MTPEFIRVLPYRSKLSMSHDPDQPELDVCLWRSDTDRCEHGDHSPCDAEEGLLYGSALDPVTWFCPRHWYEMHAGPNAAYHLVDLTPEEHERQRQRVTDAFASQWTAASGRIEQAANILVACGLKTQAGKLWEAHGFIRSSLTHL